MMQRTGVKPTPPASVAASSDQQITDAHLNGYFWKASDQGTRFTYVASYRDAVWLAFDNLPSEIAEQLKKTLWTTNIAGTDVLTRVDAIYANVANLPIPLIYVVNAVILRANGMSEDATNNMISRFPRNCYAPTVTFSCSLVGKR